MRKNLTNRMLLVISVVVISVYYSLPSIGRLPPGVRRFLPGSEINLGLDLKGGMHLVLEVDTDEALRDITERNVQNLKAAFVNEKIIPVTLAAAAGKRCTIEAVFSSRDNKETAKVLIKRDYPHWVVEEEGERLFLTLADAEAGGITRAVRSQALENIRRRVDESGLREPSIQPQGEKRIVVQLPGIVSSERAKALIGKTAKLEFHLAKKPDELWALITKIDEAVNGELISYIEPKGKTSGINFHPQDRKVIDGILNGQVAAKLTPHRYRFAFGAAREEGLQGLYLIEKTVELSGELLTDAYMGYQMMQPVVNIRFNRKGALIFEKLTDSHKGEPLAIVLDGLVESAPYIDEKIPRTSTGYIRGSFTAEEANDLAVMLKAGALPATVRVEFEQTVGPSLGSDSIRKGLRAAVLGGAFVMVFMGGYYLLAGLIADFALCLNLVIVAAVLAGFGATLTLPGIAGLILTIGMAVDANVLIFERIREEVKAGKTIRLSIASGYSKAFVTILDANVTTLIAAVALLQFGTGPIRGFAITLTIGILASMFTAVIVTRLILDLLCTRQSFSHIHMFQLLGKPNIDFVKVRHVAFTVSAVMLITGLCFLAGRGRDNLGIDFRGGTLLLRSFSSPVDVGQVRDSLGQAGLEKSIVQGSGDGSGVVIKTRLKKGGAETAVLIDECLRKTFGDVFKDPQRFGSTSFVGASVGKDLRRQAIWAVVFSLIGIVLYISWRFQFRFAIAAIIALVHDVLITLGLFSLTGREITLPVIAAVLTIIGYSLNDTIVVFDRIRENRRLLYKEKYSDVVNISINQTLSRTILTSLTTLFVVLSIFLFGGEAIHDFSFALLVGVVVGTYSSIFIASPALVMMNK